MLHRKRLARDLAIHFDWIGLVLFTGSLTTFLLGLNWGGSLYVSCPSFVMLFILFKNFAHEDLQLPMELYPGCCNTGSRWNILIHCLPSLGSLHAIQEHGEILAFAFIH
jgi:hypothetical protein